MPKNRKSKGRSRSRARKASPKKRHETSDIANTQESSVGIPKENDGRVVQSGETEILVSQEIVRQEDAKDEVVEETIDDEVLQAETEVTASVQNEDILESKLFATAEDRAIHDLDTQQKTHQQDSGEAVFENLESKYSELAPLDKNDKKISNTNSIENIGIENQSSLKSSQVEDPGTYATSKDAEHNASFVTEQMESTCLETIVVEHIDKEVIKERPKIEVIKVQEINHENENHDGASISLEKQSVKEMVRKVEEPSASSMKGKLTAPQETNHPIPHSSNRSTSDPSARTHRNASFSSKSVNSREGDYSSAPEKEPLLKKSQNDREDMLAKRRSRKFCCC